MVWGARRGLDSPHAMRPGALVSLTRPACLPHHHRPGLKGTTRPAEGRGMLLPRMAAAPPHNPCRQMQEPRMVWGARRGLDSPHAMRPGALVALTRPACLPHRHRPGLKGTTGPAEGRGMLLPRMVATRCHPLLSLSFCHRCAWLRNLCDDGDVESNPGPSHDAPIGHPPNLPNAPGSNVTIDPLVGDAFMIAQQQSNFVNLAMSSSAQVLGPSPRLSRGRKRPVTDTTIMSESDGEAATPRHCPFPACVKSFLHGFGGWTEKKLVTTHVATVHVAAGEIPSASWLQGASRWVCGHCLRLIPEGRKCVGENCFRVKAEAHAARLPPVSHPALPMVATSSVQAPPCIAQTMSLDNANPALSDLINDILGKSRPLFRHIPRAAVAKWGIAWADVLTRLCKERTWEALRDWAMFQKITLWSPRGGPRTTKGGPRSLFAQGWTDFEQASGNHYGMSFMKASHDRTGRSGWLTHH